MPMFLNLFVLFLVVNFVSMVMELERIGKNLEKNKSVPKLSYISHGLVSVVCGFIFGMIGMLFEKEEILVWLLFGSIGSILGKKALIITLKLLNNNLEFFKGTLSEEEIENYIDEPKDEKEE